MLKVGGSDEGASVAPAMPGAEQGGRRRPIRLDPSSKGRPGTAITPKPIRPSRPALRGAETASDSVATSPRARAHDLREPSKLASLEVVVDHSGRLHQRVGGGRPDEAEAAPSHSGAKAHKSASRVSPRSCKARVATAFAIAASILPRWRTIRESARSRSTSRSPKAAILSMSQSSKARRKPSRLRRIVS